MAGLVPSFDWSLDVQCVGAALEKERTQRHTTLETRGEATAAAAAFHLAAAQQALLQTQ